MNEIKMLMAEAKIDHMEIDLLIKQLDHPYYIYEEAGKESLLAKVANKIENVIDKIKKSIISFFSSTKVKEAENNLNAAMTNDPSLKNKKIKAVDRKKLDDLNSQTLKELNISKDPEKVMKKYKKQRNIILSTLVPISIGAFMMYNKQNKYKKTSEEYQQHFQQVHATLDKTNEDLDIANRKLKVYADFMRTAETDTLNAFKEYLINCSRMSNAA